MYLNILRILEFQITDSIYLNFTLCKFTLSINELLFLFFIIYLFIYFYMSFVLCARQQELLNF